ncbi:uncharacterized protein DS421_14g468570 [Arachis hypogaea]|nr:uncharacterized protein DS421_14g468570 [Arachis hypogaea]
MRSLIDHREENEEHAFLRPLIMDKEMGMMDDDLLLMVRSGVCSGGGGTTRYDSSFILFCFFFSHFIFHLCGLIWFNFNYCLPHFVCREVITCFLTTGYFLFFFFFSVVFCHNQIEC